jgi:phage/plasmid-like protein (TIGR03299 family)
MANAARPVPIWNRVGTKVEGSMSAQEALQKGKLDWTVELQPAKVTYNGKTSIVPGKFVPVRTSDGRPLGIVGASYKPVQNTDALNFMDTYIGRKEAEYVTVGNIGDGKLIWMLAKMPNTSSDVDVVERYMLMSTSHNGVSPVMLAALDFRIWCANQIQAAIRKAKNKFVIRHTTNVDLRMDDARKAFDGSLKYFGEMDMIFGRMKEIKFSQTQLLTLVEKVFGAANEDKSNRQVNRIEAIQEKIVDLSLNGMGTHLPGVKGTLWGAYNSVTEYLDHHTKIKGGKGASAEEKLLGSTWFGTIGMKTQKAFDTALEMGKLAA